MNRLSLKFNIIPILIGMVGLLTAFVLGMFIGGGEMLNLAVIFGALFLILVMAGMRQYIWLLIPMFWGFTGSISILPVPFSVRDLMMMLVAASAFAMLALRIYRFRNKWGLLDFLLLLNLGQVALAFVKHPTGLRALSSESVGARPYFNIGIATLAYFILANQTLPAKLARRLPIFVLIPEALSSLIVLAIRLKPGIGYILGRLYTGFAPVFQVASTGPGVQRLSIGSGATLTTTMCSYFRPLTLLSPLKPFRFLLFLIGVGLVMVSGFRAQFIGVAAVFVLASYFQRGVSETIVVLAGMLGALMALTLLNATVLPLPLPMQRTLSFLPGRWDARAVKDAADSTEWRVQMWKDIPRSSRYIRNRIMGDGFGFTRAELMALERQQLRTGELSQEDSMIIGAFHSGPLSTVRFVGIVGLILYFALLVYTAVFAARMIRSCENSDYYAIALFIGLGMIWEPFNFIFIFGAYDSGLPDTIFSIGMLKMIHNCVAQTRSKSRRILPHGSATVELQPVRR